MAYTVKALSKLSGVSIRALHHYDEIGLLKPAYYGENHYRYYVEEQLLMLQQILFFRNLGFHLEDIKNILTSDDFDKLQALATHRKSLIDGLKQTKILIKTIDKTIEHLRGKTKMRNEEIYEGFDVEKQKLAEAYLIKKMGKTAETLIENSKNKMKDMTPEDGEAIRAETNVLCAAFVKLIDADIPPDSDAAQDLMRRHFERVKKFSHLSKDDFIALNKADIEYPECRKRYDAVHPKFAQYFLETAIIFAKRNLS